jgi:hypothetical protein
MDNKAADQGAAHQGSAPDACAQWLQNPQFPPVQFFAKKCVFAARRKRENVSKIFKTCF